MTGNVDHWNHDDRLVQCCDDANGATIIVNLDARQVLFRNCLWPRTVFALGRRSESLVPVEDIVAASVLGPSGVKYHDASIRKLVIHTVDARTAINTSAEGFDQLSRFMLTLCEGKPVPSMSIDNPVVGVIIAIVLVVALVTGLWFFA